MIRKSEDILEKKFVIIKGDDQSGKTKLCSHIFLELADRGNPVIFVNLDDIKSKKPNLDIFSQKYSEQFSGDYNLWCRQKEKTIIFDNLSHDANSLGHVILAKSLFENIIVSTSSDNYGAYFKDELRLTEFTVIRIAPFTHVKQEQLIRKWVDLKKEDCQADNMVSHGQIDQLERNINSIIISNKIIPRYPFFILSILQTYEAFMPQNMQITAYGHCYYALILAHLIKAGVDKKDVDIETCFNFASHLAFEIYKRNPSSLYISAHDFNEFVGEYKKSFIIKDSMISRLCGQYGVLKLNQDGNCCFSLPYSYYFFLGRFLAKMYKEDEDIVEKMVEKSYVRNNMLTLIFAIHHAQDIEIIDDILLHTLCAIDGIKPSKLDEHETKVFQSLLSRIPEQILSDRPIEEERLKERSIRDNKEASGSGDEVEETRHELLNQVYKSHKNMEILSQILKNKYGSLEKEKIEEIVEIICDAGLRLVRLVLCGEDELEELARYIEKKYEESEDFDPKKGRTEKAEDIREELTRNIFLWTMGNVEKIVSSLSKPEIKEIMKKVRDKKNTPAYDIIYYFYSLDTAEKLDDRQRSLLKQLVSKYDKKEMFFLRRVLSLRTQHYLNTHSIRAPLKQSISSLLGIAYRP